MVSHLAAEMRAPWDQRDVTEATLGCRPPLDPHNFGALLPVVAPTLAVVLALAIIVPFGSESESVWSPQPWSSSQL
ncbi:hypothetical protein CDL15_Pgr021778 [Punica granatum]|uniref:Uncharacterized protein n=1 Tax=Punica granatum TaxID=22663 RepID=A0A218WSK7_PUNGR|nr:hypothetical protein CDL15_Pgr021778 [Punica granatum]PKI52063.1 hypothetical protein CRG98_027479 [Punica granatum]